MKKEQIEILNTKLRCLKKELEYAEAKFFVETTEYKKSIEITEHKIEMLIGDVSRTEYKLEEEIKNQEVKKYVDM